MNRSKLIPILKSFSKEEIKEFDKFLDSPFFGCKKFVLNFYRSISEYHPEYREEDIAKEKIFKKIYEGKKFNDALVRRIISDLIRFSEEYMAYRNFRERNTFRSISLLNELRNRDLEDQFRIRSGQIIKRLNSPGPTDPELLFEKYFVNLEIKEFRTVLRDSKMHSDYSNSVEAFTVLFLRVITSYINHKTTFINEFNIKNDIIDPVIKNINIKALLKELEIQNGGYSNYLKMILYVYNLVQDKNDRESYFKLMDLLNDCPGCFTQLEMKNIYIVIIRFYNYQNEKFDDIFLAEKFNAYKLFLTDFLSADPSSRLQISFCRNYVNLCRQLGRIEKIRELHKKYHDLLPAEHKEDLINFCEAVYLFEKNKFRRSLQFASAFNMDKVIFKLDIKILKIKNYYETGYYDSVHTELDNLKHFLNSECKLTDSIVMKGKNFSRTVSSLTKFKTDPGKLKFKISVLKEKLEKERMISEKKWLTEKIKELEG